MSWINQIVAVTILNLRTIPQRLGSSAVAVVSAADVGMVAQSAPGETLSFYEVDRRAAVEALRAVRRWLDTV